MPEGPAILTPASDDELKQALAFALTFDGRRRFRHADELTAGIAAEHLVRHLAQAGFVVLRRQPGADLSGLQRGAGKPDD
jgi:hypothetical protein